jgi:hypothetical protein
VAEYRKGFKVDPETGLTAPEAKAGVTPEQAQAAAASDAVQEDLRVEPALSASGEQDARREERKHQKQLEKEAKEHQKQVEKEAKERHKEQEAFEKTPQGQARVAFEAGSELFQIDLPLSETKRGLSYFSGQHTDFSRKRHAHGSVLDAIESEGWRLEHGDYVWEQTGFVSRDKFLQSGQTGGVTGRIIGIYIFRRIGGEQRTELTAQAKSEETRPGELAETE